MIFVKGDKTKDIYTMSPKCYKKKLTDEATVHYKNAPASDINNINKEAKVFTARLDISNKFNQLYGKQAVLTVKDCKSDFHGRLSF